MERQLITKTLYIEGMTCTSCEMRIKNKLKKIPAVIDIQAKYVSGTVGITYDCKQTNLLKIIEAIESLDYIVKPAPENIKCPKFTESTESKLNITSLLGIGIIILAFYLLIQNTVGFNFIPEVSQSMRYGILFVVGLLTSLHCIAMCGGINLSQCVSYKSSSGNKLSQLKPSLLYNGGRVVSYTLIGGIVGAIGSVISLSGSAKGLVSIIAGVFMVIIGLNMLNIFPQLRKFMPRMPKAFGNNIYDSKGKNGSFYVGLLNGFMPCGPLQSMQIYAFGTGSFVSGALSMFIFSLGTVPLMFGFGAVSSIISGKFTHKMMKVSAMLVMILGVIMLNRGLSLSGIDPLSALSPVSSSASSESSNKVVYENAASVSGDVQYITTSLSGGRYTPITVQKGVPVRWTIQVEQRDLNGCNNPMVIPQYDIEVKFTPGDNIVEFTPDESGTIPYSCWMGMIRSKITVVDNLGEAPQSSPSSTSSNGGSMDSGGVYAGASCH